MAEGGAGRTPGRAAALLALLAALLLGPAQPGRAQATAAPAEQATTAQPTTSTEQAAQPASPAEQPTPPPVPAPDPPDVTAAGAVLFESTGELVLSAKDAETPRPIASTTKIMTALLALEAGTLEDTVTISPNAVAVGATPGAAKLDLQAGQQIAMRSLLTGLIMRSGNDAAVAVAEHVAGGEPAFVARMNARAAELGMTATAFVDASGLTDEPGNLASPIDLARLAAVAMANPDFASWAGARERTVPGLAPLVNRNLLIGDYPGATGVKTGYTSEAGLCLVASATRGDRTLLTVVLGSEDSFADSAALLDHGFDDYRRVVPADPLVALVPYRWAGAAVPVVAAEPLDAVAPVGAPVTWRADLAPVLARPAEAGTVAGRAELSVNGEVVDTVELRLAEPAPAQDPAAVGSARAGAAVQEALRAFARLEPVDRAA